MSKVQLKICISDNYLDLINKDLYEPVVLEIMNESATVFPDHYERIIEQSHGESDYRNLNTDQVIDAKLLFKEKQCYMLAMGKEKLEKWLDSLKNEVNELFESIKSGDQAKISASALYFEMVQRLEHIQRGEDVVLFMPYPLAVRYPGGQISYLTANIFQLLFDVIKDKAHDLTLEKRVYVIYPALDDRIVLMELTAGREKTEFLNSETLAEYVNVEIIQ